MQEINRKKELLDLCLLFAASLVIHIAAGLAISLLSQKGIRMPVELQLILSEMTILIPSLIYILAKRLSLRDDVGFRPIKVGTVFMCILLTLFVTPAATFMNVVSQLFVSNTMVQKSQILLSGSNAALVLIGALFGPLCEEFAFRGIFDRRFEIVTGPLRAGLISALLFAIVHLNFNQAGYAFILGVIFSIINRAANSIFPSFIIHACINGSNIMLLIAASKASELLGEDLDLAASAEAARAGDFLYAMIGVTLFAAIIGGLIAIPCIVWISKHEGNFDNFRKMFEKRQRTSA